MFPTKLFSISTLPTQLAAQNELQHHQQRLSRTEHFSSYKAARQPVRKAVVSKLTAYFANLLPQLKESHQPA